MFDKPSSGVESRETLKEKMFQKWRELTHLTCQIVEQMNPKTAKNELWLREGTYAFSESEEGKVSLRILYDAFGKNFLNPRHDHFFEWTPADKNDKK